MHDIVPFMLVYDLSMLILAVPMGILNMNANDEETALVPEYFGWWLMDSFFNQYLTGLGEFDTLGNITHNPW